MDVSPPNALDLDRVDFALRLRVETFLYHEAALLDRWRLREWLELMEPDSHYLIPALDRPDGDPKRDMFLVHDDRFLLGERVNGLLARSAHAEVPRSRTRRMISNVVATATDAGVIEVQANFVIHRTQRERIDTYMGAYEHRLVTHGSAYRFRRRKAVLTLETLRDQGKVSIII